MKKNPKCSYDSVIKKFFNIFFYYFHRMQFHLSKKIARSFYRIKLYALWDPVDM